MKEPQKAYNITVLSTVNGTDIVKYFRNGTQYKAMFYDKNLKALANTNIRFNINGVFYTRTTNSDGVATMKINLQPGNYIITAINPITTEQIASNIVVESV